MSVLLLADAEVGPDQKPGWSAGPTVTDKKSRTESQQKEGQFAALHKLKSIGRR